MALALVTQASRDALTTLPDLLSRLAFPVHVVGCFHREGDGVSRNLMGGCDPVPPLTLIEGVIQGPLHLFDDALSAIRALLPGFLAPSHPPLPLLTIREFGMSRFLPAPQPLSLSVSGGLGEGEWGVWGGLRPSPPSSPPTESLAVGYFRTQKHGMKLGLLVASFCALAKGVPMVILAPEDAYEEVTRGLQAHLEVASLSSFDGEEEEKCAWTLHWKGEGDSSSSGSNDNEKDSTRVTLRPLQHLPSTDFQALLATAACAVVTGDATVNEALAFGVPFWYSAEPHKVFFERDLQGCAQGVVKRVWEFLASPTAGAWEAVKQALPSTLLPSLALRAAFQAWCGSVMEERGTLERKLLDWAGGEGR